MLLFSSSLFDDWSFVFSDVEFSSVSVVSVNVSSWVCGSGSEVGSGSGVDSGSGEGSGSEVGSGSGVDSWD